MKKTTLLTVLNAVFLAITLLVNYLFNSGWYTGNTMKTISDKYHNLFTPASYAFGIWGVIYLGLIAFIVYSFSILRRERERAVIDSIGIWFIISCIANALWVVSWLTDAIGLSVLIMGILLFSLIMIVFKSNMEITNPPFRRVALVWWPFALYTGWIMVALIANVAAWLTGVGWEGAGLSEASWAIIMVLVAMLLFIVLTWTRNMRESAIAGAWGLLAVGVENMNVHSAVTVVVYVAVVALVINTGIHGIKNFRGFGNSF